MSMIIWSGLINGTWYYRSLGPSSEMSTALHKIKPYGDLVSSYRMIRHNESTTRSNGTSPTIGHDTAKISRDYCIQGYGVGSPIDEQSKEPHLFNYEADHALAYDLETEFVSKGECNMQAPILCGSLVCTCGWQLLVTRARVHDSGLNQVVLDSSEAIAVRIISAILEHAPAFIIGHNVYSFDNTVLAFALPDHHPYIWFFRSVTKSSNNTAPTMGLILDIPGINNLDTLIYIRSSMFGTFKQFSLDSLAKELNLSVLKGSTQDIKFEMEWFQESAGNTHLMSVYNNIDCRVVLKLCKHLDLINQIIALCYCSRSWIEDVMLYNTGAMATSCICFNAMLHKCTYNWTRCDWHPLNFKGGEILFDQPLIASHVMVVDFTAMYPSIIVSAGISPESIDIESSMYHQGCRFESIVVHVSLMKHYAGTLLGASVIGTDNVDAHSNDPIMECILCEWFDVVTIDPDTTYVERMLRSTIISADPSIRACKINIVLHDYVEMRSNILGQDRSMDLCVSCRKAHADSISKGTPFVPFSWHWPRSSFSYKDYAVDWIKAFPGHATIVSGPDFQARFYPGRGICSEACKSLILSRKRYKQMLKHEVGQPNANHETVQSLDQMQYACKIIANSLFGVMSFSQYNTYSPRCGSSITACGRWSITATAACIACMGLDVLYGDTDSVMFTLKGNSNAVDLFMAQTRYRPIQNYIDVLVNHEMYMSMAHLCEYLAGSPGSEFLYPRSMKNIRGLVPNIINHIMSYTCLVDLKIERQDTGIKIGCGIHSSVYKSFVLLTKKHYSAALYDNTHITKGISFVRRSGANITNIAYRRFIGVMQRYPIGSKMIEAIRNEYRGLHTNIMSASHTNDSYMIIRTTVMGITDDYVSVLYSTQLKSIKVLRSEFNRNTMKYNKDYYIDILNRCLRSILDALKIPDPGFITAVFSS